IITEQDDYQSVHSDGANDDEEFDEMGDLDFDNDAAALLKEIEEITATEMDETKMAQTHLEGLSCPICALSLEGLPAAVSQSEEIILLFITTICLFFFIFILFLFYF